MFFFPGFDRYFLGLRPPRLLSDCADPGARDRLNCRNPWFRQFWSHHFHCRFQDQVRRRRRRRRQAPV